MPNKPYRCSIGNIKVAVYDKENHGPPHVHVQCEKGVVGRIEIETREPFKNDKLPPSCLKQMKERMKEKQAELSEAWTVARERQWQEGNKP